MEDRLGTIPDFDAPDAGYGEPKELPGAPRPWLFMAVAAVVIAATTVFSLHLVQSIVGERDATARARLDERLTAETRSKLETINVWLDAVAARGNRVLRSELIALFVRESRLAAEDAELARGLTEQRPYMRAVFDDLARDHDLRGVYLLAHDGSVLLQDRDAPMLTRQAQARVQNMLQNTHDRSIQTRVDERGTVILEVVQPLQASDQLSGAPAEGGLLISVVVNPAIASWLPLDGSWRRGESQHLWLMHDDGWSVLSWTEDGLAIDAAQEPPARRRGFDVETPIDFAIATTDAHIGWIVEHRAVAAPLLRPIAEFERVARYVAIAVAALLAVITLALFWRQRAVHQRRLVEQYRQFANGMQAQASLLRSLLRSTDDWIWLRRPEGAMRFANRAFIEAVGRIDSPEQAMQQLAAPIECAEPQQPVLVATGDGPRSFHVQKREVSTPDGGADRLIVARDMTEVVAWQKRRERLLDQTIQAFARAIELVDPISKGTPPGSRLWPKSWPRNWAWMLSSSRR